MNVSVAVSLLLLVLLLLALLGWWWERHRASRGSRARLRVAAAGESGAEALLEAHGFSIVERQAWADWALEVDGEEVAVSCRADLLVERGGEVFVAEVKTGDRAPDPARPATRRQLLEYALAFEVEGVLLVDMDQGRIRWVRLPIGPSG